MLMTEKELLARLEERYRKKERLRRVGQDFFYDNIFFGKYNRLFPNYHDVQIFLHEQIKKKHKCNDHHKLSDKEIREDEEYTLLVD